MPLSIKTEIMFLKFAPIFIYKLITEVSRANTTKKLSCKPALCGGCCVMDEAAGGKEVLWRNGMLEYWNVENEIEVNLFKPL